MEGWGGVVGRGVELPSRSRDRTHAIFDSTFLSPQTMQKAPEGINQGKDGCNFHVFVQAVGGQRSERRPFPPLDLNLHFGVGESKEWKSC